MSAERPKPQIKRTQRTKICSNGETEITTAEHSLKYGMLVSETVAYKDPNMGEIDVRMDRKVDPEHVLRQGFKPDF